MKTRNVLAGMISADNYDIMQNTLEWLVANMAGNETPYVSAEDVYFLINQPIGCSTKKFPLDEHYIWKEFFCRLMTEIERPAETTRATGFFCITETRQSSASQTAKNRLKTLFKWAVDDIVNHYENMTRVEQTNDLFDLLNHHLAYFLIDKKFDIAKSLPSDLWTNFEQYPRHTDLPAPVTEIMPYVEMLLQLAETAPEFMDEKHNLALWNMAEGLASYDVHIFKYAAHHYLQNHGEFMIEAIAANCHNHLNTLKKIVFFARNNQHNFDISAAKIKGCLRSGTKAEFIKFLQHNCETSAGNPQEEDLFETCRFILEKFGKI